MLDDTHGGFLDPAQQMGMGIGVGRKKKGGGKGTVFTCLDRVRG